MIHDTVRPSSGAMRTSPLKAKVIALPDELIDEAEQLDEIAPSEGINLRWPSSEPEAQDAVATYLKAEGRQHG